MPIPRTFDGWRVEQFGRSIRYPRDEGWEGNADADGLVLQRRGQEVWYYGTFRASEVDAFEKDD